MSPEHTARVILGWATLCAGNDRLRQAAAGQLAIQVEATDWNGTGRGRYVLACGDRHTDDRPLFPGVVVRCVRHGWVPVRGVQ